MSNKQKKGSFSLVEALIAIALFSLVIGTLFGLFWHEVRITDELSRIKQNSEKVRKAHLRLQTIFSKCLFKSEKCHLFHTLSKKARSESDQGQSLLFTFDNGTDREDGFSYDVIARLYLDTKKNLCLAIWPNPTLKQSEPEKIRKEVLLEGTESMKLEFWKVADQKSKIPKEKQEKWLSTWEEEYKDVPTFVRMTLEMGSGKGRETLAFSFIAAPDDIEEIKYE